jgi:hypothetical protein
MSKQKLELTWIGKEKQPVLEPRILIEDPERIILRLSKASMKSDLNGDTAFSVRMLKR